MGSESGDLALKSKWGIGEDQLDSWLVRFANLLVMYEWEIELTVTSTYIDHQTNGRDHQTG